MKRLLSIVLSLAVLTALSAGCDRIRASLGKPTSKDLVKISDELKAREQFLRDSVAAVRAAQAQSPADSAAVQPAVQPAVEPAAQPAVPSAPVAEAPLKRYYAVAGAFRNPDGATRFAARLQAKGLAVHFFDFRSGLKVVCLEGHDDFEAARRDVAALKELGLSDSDPWIYNTKQKLHK